MESNEETAAVALGKLCFVVQRHGIRSPVRRENRRGAGFVRAYANFLAAIATIFRRENELLLEGVVVTLRPAIVPILL